jgi:hypothetical protein
VFRRISSAWPTSQVLSIIESSVYRDPRNERVDRFDLGAFRDLLMLHAVAQSVMSAAVASMQGEGSGAAPMVPLSMAAALTSAPTFTRPSANSAALPTLDSEVDEVDLDLDLDLTDNIRPATASTFDLMLPSVPAALVSNTESVAKPDNNLLEFDPSGFDSKLKLPGAP